MQLGTEKDGFGPREVLPEAQAKSEAAAPKQATVASSMTPGHARDDVAHWRFP